MGLDSGSSTENVDERSEQLGDVFLGVSGAEGEAKAGLITRNRWVTDGREKDAEMPELLGDLQGIGFAAEQKGKDGAVAPGRATVGCGGRRGIRVGRGCVERFVGPDAGQTLSGLVNAIPELVAEEFSLCRGDEFDGTGGGGGSSGHGSGGEDETASAVHEEIDQGAGPTDEASGCAESFAKSSHLDFHVGIQAELVDETASELAIEAGGMGFIDHEPGAITFFEFDQFAERCDITVHGKDRLSDDEDPAWIFRG